MISIWVSLMLWIWIFFFPFLFGLLGFLMGVNFLNSGYIFMWDISVFRESNFEVLFLFDLFSMMFFFMVGLVSSFVLLYSNYYMQDSVSKKKFVVVMMVFIVSMFILSVSGDLMWLMVGWDGLGFSSMCLIFFFQNWKSFNSAMVTFISNRIGDFFIISFFCFNLMMKGDLFCEVGVGFWLLGGFLCFGAFSKSAQVPFSAWLPLAMAAPTPVSSLVHSSTLVTAGVFLLIRFKSFLSKDLFKLVFLVSFLTIVLAGMSSLGEYDLKKVIALSTLSHIGLMMMFVGMESFVSAKIHLVIHAFFKSLLFMISGFIIHDNNNCQDVRMISVSLKNCFFSFSFILSLMSMMGAPFFSGFFSKEILLSKVFCGMSSVDMVLLFFFSVSLTCSYSVRLLIYLFFPFFSFVPLVSEGEYPEKVFFLMSVISSFFSGVMILMIISKEGFVSLTLFSSFQKVGLLVMIILGFLVGLLFTYFFYLLSNSMKKVCHMMWMIGSMNKVFHKLVYNSSFYMMTKGDVKGMMDYYVLFFFDLFFLVSKVLMSGLFMNPFIYMKMCCWIGMIIFFFELFLIDSESVLNLGFSNVMIWDLHEEMEKFKSGFHPFHVVDLSPWPLMMSLSVFSLVLNLYHYLNFSGEMIWMMESFISSLIVSVLWWRDVIRESTFQGHHTMEVQKGLVWGVLMFISSEVMFFFSFFFGFLFSALCPDVEIGGSWPPVGIEPLSFMMVPFLNTLILLSSGVSITWSHHALLDNNFNNSLFGMMMTVVFGLLFSFLQYEEYYSCSFTMADSVYGSFFFLMTGFHGVHVMVGVLFIFVSLFRFKIGHYSKSHHFGFEASAWYWHFVDVVWLFLYVMVYWWGS